MKYTLIDKLNNKIVFKTDKYINAIRMYFVFNANNEDRQYKIESV